MSEPTPGAAKPKRIQRKRTKGWRMPEGAICVGRGSKWGNPFIVGTHGRVDQCLTLYVLLLHGYLNISVDPAHVKAQERALRAVREDIGELKGKTLACWCREGERCHGDVLLAYANGGNLASAMRGVPWPKLTRIN